jgi:hypothetical protein
MTSLSSLAPLAIDASHADKLAWAGERLWDVAEGSLSGVAGQLALQVVWGWLDLGTAEEKAQYRVLGVRLADALAAAAE